MSTGPSNPGVLIGRLAVAAPRLPTGVQVMGRVHGGLAIEAEWGVVKTARAFLASLVPFGAFWLEKKLREEERALSAS